MVVRHPNEPTEQYQADKDDAPYEAKLNSPYPTKKNLEQFWSKPDDEARGLAATEICRA